MQALLAVQKLRLSSWCIGAGAVRNLVWDALHQVTSPAAASDVDVAYYDATNLSAEQDTQLQEALASCLPGVPWEVTNQAGVHQWFEACFGHAVEPLRSLEEAVGSWPEYATSVGIFIRPDGSLQVISVETYLQRVAQRQYAEHWPTVNVVPC